VASSGRCREVGVKIHGYVLKNDIFILSLA
jgi:hypothetical protein